MSNMTDAIKHLTVATCHTFYTRSDGMQTTISKMLRKLRIVASKNSSKWFSVKHLCTNQPKDEFITEPGNFISISSFEFLREKNDLEKVLIFHISIPPISKKICRDDSNKTISRDKFCETNRNSLE